MLQIVSCKIKGNFKVIYFHIKSRGVKGLVFVQITFEKYTTNFCFENSEVGIENDNCLSTALISMKRFCIFLGYSGHFL